MDIIFELILELLIEGGMEVSTNRKISKWIRYPVALILALFFAAVIFGMLFFGIFLLQSNLFAALFIILIGLFALIGSAEKIRNIYRKEKNQEENHYDEKSGTDSRESD